MPQYSMKTEAGVASIEGVRERLLDSPKTRDPKKFSEIARPFTSKMTQLQPSLSKEFESRLSTKHSWTKSLNSYNNIMLILVLISVAA